MHGTNGTNGTNGTASPDVKVLRLADRDETLTRATGSTDGRVHGWLVNDVALALNTPPGLTGRAREDRVCAAVSALCDIGPRDTVEGMLAAQMLATHSAALECLRRAADPDTAERARDSNLRYAARLLTVFERQVKLRDDRRNPGLTRSVAGDFWNGPGGRHRHDSYGCGAAKENDWVADLVAKTAAEAGEAGPDDVAPDDVAHQEAEAAVREAAAGQAAPDWARLPNRRQRRASRRRKPGNGGRAR